MEHVTTPIANEVRMRAHLDRRSGDAPTADGHDALAGFKGILTGTLLGVALWVLLFALYFLI